MSSSSTCRIRDHGGGSQGGNSGGASAAKASALRHCRSVTPVSSSDKIAGSDSFRKMSSGKENHRSTSRGAAMTRSQTQKPAIRPMPRVDKASLVAAGSDGERMSTSSVPRGRSSSPSEFGRLFSDLRKDRRVSVDRIVKDPTADGDRSVYSGGKGVKGSAKNEIADQTKRYKDSNTKASDNFRYNKDSLNSETKSGNNGVLEKKVGEREKVKAFLSSNVAKSNAVNVKGVSQIFVEKGNSECVLKVPNRAGIDGRKEESCSIDAGKVGYGEQSCFIECGEKPVDKGKDLNIEKEKVPGDEVTGGKVGAKYPSKLHEKLAFLEGKVKRIASDIRRTKEMLDMNNPDASKMILSDIQYKISGIEKAMGKVTSDSDAKMGSLKSSEIDHQGPNVVDNSEIKQSEKGKCSVKGLNSEQLEARLFPHHKLLKNRSTIKTSSGNCLSNKSSVIETGPGPNVEENVLSPVDENSIAVAFLSSLNKETNKITSRDGEGATEYCEVQETEDGVSAGNKNSSSTSNQKCDMDLFLASDEKLDEFDDQEKENRQGAFIGEDTDDTFMYSLNEIGNKTSVAGWFVSEGEAVLLAHDDGSCSYYDITNCEEKTLYMPPPGVSANIWRDCWIIRAPGSDGCSGRFVVAASGGSTMDSGFCSWDYYTKDVRAYHAETGTTTSRTILGPLPNNIVQRRNSASSIVSAEARQWWYTPCGPLIISTASSQRAVKVFDVRDGEQIMKWDVQKPVSVMDYSSPLQWRNRGKVVIAEAENISLWDVNSLSPQALLSVSSSSRKISALHVSNTDAEFGGGVRQRVSSSEAEGNDGMFCTSDSINILDFRQPSGVGLRMSKLGVNVQSVFCRGDSVFLGCTNSNPLGKKLCSSQLQQFSLRKQGLFSTYTFPESNAHSHHAAITQVWGNSDFAMGVNGQGLFVFDTLKDNALHALNIDCPNNPQSVREVIGPDDLYLPSFDYTGSRALLISRDRPAMWRHMS